MLIWLPFFFSGGINRADKAFLDYTARIVDDDNGIPTITNHRVSRVIAGCGAYNQKCFCHQYGRNAVNMVGRGTTDTATGLEFTCSFHVGFTDGSGCACHLIVNIPYWGRSSFRHQCPCLTGFKWKIGQNWAEYGSDNLVKI